MANSFKTRQYQAIIYPESAPEDFLERIERLQVGALLSPLHDSDVNGDGELKKPHYHFIISYDGPKTIEQAIEDFEYIGAVYDFQSRRKESIVKSFRVSARYLCHIDNPDKYQYSYDGVRAFGGLVYSDIISSSSDKLLSLREMLAYCKEEKIIYFSDLLEYAAENRSDWFDALNRDCSYIMSQYLKSLGYKMKVEYEKEALRKAP